MKIYTLKSGTSNEADRLELARLLIKMGYTVRVDREKIGSKDVYRHFVEYNENGGVD
jgi:hypothetical protein